MAAIYRKERWELLLASALYTLRDVATRLSLVKAHVEYSLELSSLSSAVVDAAQAKAIAQTAVATLLAGSGGSEGEGGEGAPTPLVYPVAPGSGVASALQMVAGFCPQDPNAGNNQNGGNSIGTGSRKGLQGVVGYERFVWQEDRLGGRVGGTRGKTT